MNDFDVLVLGGGSAGTAAAAAARAAGARTAMIQDGELGGLCILRGCMPTKALLASAHAVHEARHLEPFGARLEGEVVVDFPRVMQRKQEQVLRFQRAKIRSVESQDYEVLFGRPRFNRDGAVELDGRVLRARGYVIATGSVPLSLPIAGVDEVPVWTSDDVMRLATAPSSLIVQGAGPVGLELAQFFARMGTRVLLVNRTPLLSRHDAECGAALDLALREEPRLELEVPAVIERVAPRGSGLTAWLRCGERLRRVDADALLMAVGRRPALDDLGLEHVGLDPLAASLVVDETMRSAHPRIWVAGDATGRFQVLHLANAEGAAAGRNAAGALPPRKVDYRLKMNVIFTDPPFAQIGADREELRALEGRIAVGRARFPETGRAITMGVRHGLWKLLADPASGQVLGSSILGPRADDLVHLIALMMAWRRPVTELPDLPWYHPTLSEVLLDLARDLAPQLRMVD